MTSAPVSRPKSILKSPSPAGAMYAVPSAGGAAYAVPPPFINDVIYSGIPVEPPPIPQQRLWRQHLEPTYDVISFQKPHRYTSHVYNRNGYVEDNIHQGRGIHTDRPLEFRRVHH